MCGLPPRVCADGTASKRQKKDKRTDWWGPDDDEQLRAATKLFKNSWNKVQAQYCLPASAPAGDEPTSQRANHPPSQPAGRPPGHPEICADAWVLLL